MSVPIDRVFLALTFGPAGVPRHGRSSIPAPGARRSAWCAAARRAAATLWCVLLAASAAPSPASGAGLSVRIGGPFPDMVFEALLAPEDYGLLGLKRTEGAFRLTEIPGRVLVLEFFNRYCATCQRQAPYLESFFRYVSSGDLEGRVRVLAVGVGNRPKQLSGFRRELELTYPIAPDATFDRYRELGDPGGTPFTLFLLREGDRWVLADRHLGMQGDVELVARVRVLLEGRTDLSRLSEAPRGQGPNPPLGLDDRQQLARARSFLSRVAEGPVDAEPAQTADGSSFFRALGAGGKPTGLYARISSREPVCDVCHAVHFLFAFDAQGRARGFEPIHVTKYGNEVWSPEDATRMESRLVGRPLGGLLFDPEVDAVTSATMSSALIFDEVRRAAPLAEAAETR